MVQDVRAWAPAAMLAVVVALAACTPSSPDPGPTAPGPAASVPAASSPPGGEITAAPTATAAGVVEVPRVRESAAPAPPEGVVVETEAGPVVGDGRLESCTSAALGRAVRLGGAVSFDCGGEATIVIEETVTVCNTVDCAAGGEPLAAVRIVGAREITLAGQGLRPLLYANSCEAALGSLPGECEGRPTPHVILDGLTLIDGDSAGGPSGPDGALGVADLEGGGAIAMRGGRLSIVDSFLSGHRCGAPDQGSGGAVLVRDMSMAVEIDGSTFAANDCGQGGAIAALRAPVLITGSSIVDNIATRTGGGIVTRGVAETLEVSLSTVAGNAASRGAGIDYDASEGTLIVRDSRVAGNAPDAGSNTEFAGIHADAAKVTVVRSVTD